MPELPQSIQTLLGQFGLSKESVQKFKFGGIVGKVALIALGGFATAIGAAKYTAGAIQVVCVIAILGATVLVIRWILDYADKHPVSATLEGAEIILWQQQQQIMMAAVKGLAAPANSPLVPNTEKQKEEEGPEGGQAQ